MKPILSNISTFDTNKGASVYFTYTGSRQIKNNEFKITELLSGKVVYQFKYESFEKVHHVPPAILNNGYTYTAEIRVELLDGEVSEWSSPLTFKTSTTPVLDIVSIDGDGYVYNNNVTFEARYSQNEGEIILRYRFSVYNENNVLLKNYPIRQNKTKENLTIVSETVEDLEKGKGYYVEVMIETESNMFYTHKERFIPMFIAPYADGVMVLGNDEDNGFVRVSAKLIALKGAPITIDKDYQYEYVDGEWVVVPKDIPIVFNGLGMNRASDFIIKLWFRNVEDGEKFLSFEDEEGNTGIDFYKKKDRVVAVKKINGVVASYASNKLSIDKEEEGFLYVKVIEHRLDLILKK